MTVRLWHVLRSRLRSLHSGARREADLREELQFHLEREAERLEAAGMRLELSSGIDWFDLHGSIDFGDGRSAPFPQLLAAVARGEDVVVLDDGSVGLLPEEWLRRYLSYDY